MFRNINIFFYFLKLCFFPYVINIKAEEINDLYFKLLGKEKLYIIKLKVK